MQIFREKILRGTMGAFTALIFLNMGFFMMEVRILGLGEDRQLMENISKMMTGAAFEEERDGNPQSSTQNVAEEEYLARHHSTSCAGCYFLLAEHASFKSHAGNLQKGYLKKFCPPPEI